MSCGKVKQNTLTDTFRKKRRRKTAKKKKRKRTAPPAWRSGLSRFCENYARRASFSTVKRRSRLTLTGRRRQATFAGIFVFDTSPAAIDPL